MRENNRSGSRLKLILPLLDEYRADELLNSIAAAKYPCDRYTHCGTFPSNKVCIDESSDCRPVRDLRTIELDYLADRIYGHITKGTFDLWDRNTGSAIAFLLATPIQRPISYLQLWFWLKKSYLFKDDLAVFCEAERIDLEFEGAQTNQNTTTEATHTEKENCTTLIDSAAKPAPLSILENNTELDSNPEISTNQETEDIPQPPLENIDQVPEISKAISQIGIRKSIPIGRRFDALAAEIDPILHDNPTLTATQLMNILLRRIGQPDTCIISNTGEGLQWEPLDGDPKNLTRKSLEDRIARWKKGNRPLTSR